MAGNTLYFNTRPEARAYARNNRNVVFKDFGKTAAKGQRWATVAVAAVTMPTKSEVQAAKATRDTKKEAVITLLKATGVTKRSDALPLLIEKLGLSHNCANTYFYNIKTGKWK